MWMLHVLRHYLVNESALRTSFVLSVVTMLFSNTIWLILFMSFVHIFGSINGWTTVDVLGLNAFSTLGFGLGFILAPGVQQISGWIQGGRLDRYLLYPRPLLATLMVSASNVTVLADLLYGIGLFVLYFLLAGFDWQSFVMIVFGVPVVSVLYVAFSIFGSCIAFYRPDDRMLTGYVFRVFLLTGQQPMGAFPRPMKIFFTFVMPSFLAGAWQIEALKRDAWWILAALYVGALAWIFLTVWTFDRGLRRYESGGGGGE